MSNVLNQEVLIDGPRNYVLKLVGTVDTSDIAATGTIGASGFTTTIGSKTVSFVAGALVPTVGQYLTFGDGTTTFSAGTYVTSIISATSITVNQAAKATNVAAAVTITGTAGSVVIADPALVQPTPYWPCTNFILDRVTYMIEPALEVRLDWEATANQRLLNFLGSGHTPDYKRFGGLPNNSGAGKTGKLLLSTQGWTASAILSFTLTLELKKQGS
jgi:hypothetical protein